MPRKSTELCSSAAVVLQSKSTMYLTGKGHLQPLTQPNKPVLYKCSSFQRQVDN